MHEGPIEQVVGPLRQIAESYWNTDPVVFRRTAGELDGLLSRHGFQTLLRETRIPVGMFRLLKDGAPISARETSTPMRIEGREIMRVLDPVRVRAEMRRGASLLLAGLDEYWQPVRVFCSRLGRAIGVDVTAFAVVTPPHSGGFAPHADKQDQLVVQCEGRKDWLVWPPRIDLVGQGVDEEDLPPPALRTQVSAADMLYLPKGAPHRAFAGESLSIHITFILTSQSLGQLASDAAVAGLAGQTDAERTLPPYWFEDPEGYAERIQRLLVEAAESTDVERPLSDTASAWSHGEATRRVEDD